MSTIELVICILIIFVITFFSIHIGLYGEFWKKAEEIKEDKSLDANSRYLLSLALALIVVGFGAPFIFTGKNSTLDFIGSGEIGDTMGGLMSPFINVAAVIVTGLAFYAQYRANDMVRKQFELQKFENQFYEMLRLHKENVNEIEVKVFKEISKVRGRECFLEMKKELEWLLENLEEELDNEIFAKIYEVFFWGYDNKRKESVVFSYKKSNSKNLSNNYEENNKYTNWREKMDKGHYDHYHKLPEGHHSYLGHYYRHLFYIVKFVVYQKKELVSEYQKVKYLKILRNQLSNYEQEMLFYNWLSGYGKNWENEENSFFTKYKMIHNLWYSNLYGDDFIKEKLKGLVKKYKEQEGEGNLFEIEDKIDENFS